MHTLGERENKATSVVFWGWVNGGVCGGGRAVRTNGNGTEVRAVKHQKRKQGSETGIQVPVVLVCKPSTGTHPHVDPQMGRGGLWGSGVWVMRLQEQLLLSIPSTTAQLLH